AATLFVAAIATVPAFAQRSGAAPATPTTTPAATAQGGSSTVPSSKIAFVNTQAFADEKAGITRFVAALKNLDREFKPRRDELTTLATRIQTLAKEIEQTRSVADPKTLQIKQDEGEKLQRELKFKKEEAEAAFQKRSEEVLGAITNDILKALDGYAKQRGITSVLDWSKMEAMLMLDPSADITAAFIADYNSKNPATASTAAPGR
ncbi:MAG: OmpH family outer membrane protein, partial [Pyrinomonadaceae bacterium]|nr:OmpH family outer membrane protein [Pyrinomonadaceae bacterium]